MKKIVLTVAFMFTTVFSFATNEKVNLAGAC